MPQARERGPEVAHTPASPGLNASPGVPGPPVPSQERTTTHTPQALATMKPHRGLAFGAPFLWQRGAGVWGFVDEGRESPASRVAAHTPRRREQPRESRHHPHKEKCAGVAPKRVARRPGRAKLPTPTNHRTPAPQETPPPTPGTTSNPTTPTPSRSAVGPRPVSGRAPGLLGSERRQDTHDVGSRRDAPRDERVGECAGAQEPVTADRRGGES